MKLPTASDIAKLASEEPLFNQAKKRRSETDISHAEQKKQLQDAFRQGLERGFLRGFQQGKKEANEELIRRLLEHNCNLTFISSVTGLTEDQVNRVLYPTEE